MFLFNCCVEVNTGTGYQVKDNQSKKELQFVKNLQQLTQKQLQNPSKSILKLKKSQYESIYEDLQKTNKLFTDHQFAPNQDSLGYIEGLNQVKWKRISDLIPSPTLFASNIEPSQIIKGTLGDCYFLSALAALAEQQQRILAIFGDQKYNKKGIYKVLMHIKGELQQIVVDDFIPINQHGQPLFCQPNNNEFWVLILQKVWAKINGSYAKIIMGTPSEVLRSFTFAPCEMISMKEKNQQKQRLWNKFLQYSKRLIPICCKTSDSMELTNSLQPSHTFTFLSAAILEDTQGVHHKIVKLRDPWCNSMWTGSASEKDKVFWNKIIGDGERKQIQKIPKGGSKGIFYITFNDFCEYFKQIHFCLLLENASYISQHLISNRKNGNLYKFNVEKKGFYSFSLNQYEINELRQQSYDETACRSTLLIIKYSRQTNQYDFINGTLKYNEENVSLTEELDVGAYILFAKIDPTRNKGLMPLSTFIGLYSSYYIQFQAVQKLKFPNLLKDTFLKHAREHKKNKYNNNLMWVSSKLLFQQGGYAYIAFGNDSSSNKKFIVDIDEQQFSKLNFKLKGQYKNISHLKVQILPGEQKIFLSRVENKMIKALKFPPAIGIKMQMVQ